MGGVGGGLEKLRLRLTQSQFGIELRLTGTELGKKQCLFKVTVLVRRKKTSGVALSVTVSFERRFNLLFLVAKEFTLLHFTSRIKKLG